MIYELTLDGYTQRQEEHRFVKEFLNDLHEVDDTEKLHPLAVERGFYEIAGTSSIKADDVEYLFTLSSPDKAHKDYVL